MFIISIYIYYSTFALKLQNSQGIEKYILYNIPNKYNRITKMDFSITKQNQTKNIIFHHTTNLSD